MLSSVTLIISTGDQKLALVHARINQALVRCGSSGSSAAGEHQRAGRRTAEPNAQPSARPGSTSESTRGVSDEVTYIERGGRGRGREGREIQREGERDRDRETDRDRQRGTETD